MKHTCITAALLGLLLIGCQSSKTQYYEKHLVFPEGATLEQKVDMASRLTPSPQQLQWQQLELTAFLHFGINTFTNKEWGDGQEDPRLFNPTQLDAEQWARTLKEAGFKMVILTAKHHDGFCLWPTATTRHSVASSPWKEGKGDVVKELKEACDKYGLKFGVYLSPWDRNAECYGDSPRYNQLFIQQLTELLTHYGEIHEVWFDGACGEGPNGKKQVYDWDAFYKTIQRLQPNAVMAIMGDDVRWVGNEKGFGRETEWSATALVPGIYQRADSVNQALGLANKSEDLGSRELLARANELFWYPSEVDVSIRPGWFYHPAEDNQVKSLARLVDIYFESVGYNSVLLLNIPPDTRGLIHENDARRLHELGQYIQRTFATDYSLAGNRTFTGREGDSFEIEIQDNVPVNTLMLQEDIEQGQRIEAFTVEASIDGTWLPIAQGTTVGYKRLVRFDNLVADKLRVTIDRSRADFSIARVGLYYAQPIIETTDTEGLNLITPKSCRLGNQPAPQAIDGNSTTAARGEGLVPIVVDLGEPKAITGFCYTPVAEGNTEGTLFRYHLYRSNDGQTWERIVANGEFSNIKNNPIPQVVALENIPQTRYLKLEPLEEIDGRAQTSVAELGVVAP